MASLVLSTVLLSHTRGASSQLALLYGDTVHSRPPRENRCLSLIAEAAAQEQSCKPRVFVAVCRSEDALGSLCRLIVYLISSWFVWL